MMSRKNHQKISLKLALAAALALVSGACAPAPAVAPITTIPANQFTFPMAPNGQAPYTTITGVSQEALNQILGNYGGTVATYDWNHNIQAQQGFSINISQVQVQIQGQPAASTLPQYAYLKFDSNGALGPIHFESFLGLGFNAYPSGGVLYYSFSSEAKTVSNLSETPISVELIIGLRNGQFDPTQSAIFIKDCGFSQGVVCSNVSSDTQIVNHALGKR